MGLAFYRSLARHLAVVLACAIVVQTIVPAALAAARLAQRLELKSLGLIETIDCHSISTSDQPASGKVPTPLPKHEADCDCCLTGCGAAAPAALPGDRGALSRPLVAADAATRRALDAARLRSFLSERTHPPRSPPTTS